MAKIGQEFVCCLAHVVTLAEARLQLFSSKSGEEQPRCLAALV